MDASIGFLLILPFIAFLYGSVGHGGASGYLALMSLFGMAPEEMKPAALIMNLFVAGIAFYQFWKAGHFRLNLLLVFAITSIPFSFVGGTIQIDSSIYKKVLAVLILFSLLKISGIFTQRTDNKNKEINWFLGIPIGAGIGFLSGLIGIGGGIILSPIILLLRWGNVKEAAAASALFIWLNSAAGLGGQLSAGVQIEKEWFVWVVFAITGGAIGAYFGSKKFNQKILRYLLALVLLLASVKLFFT